MRRQLPTQEERQIARSRWHGITITAWSAMVLMFGKTQFDLPAYRYFVLPYWMVGSICAFLGLLVLRLATNRAAIAKAIPGRIIGIVWTLIAIYLVMGNFRLIHIPIYVMLAYNSYTFLVRE